MLTRVKRRILDWAIKHVNRQPDLAVVRMVERAGTYYLIDSAGTMHAIGRNRSKRK